MFEGVFSRPDAASSKSAITATEELIDANNISMKTRLIDPNSITGLEVIMFNLAEDSPSQKQLLMVQALTQEGWTHSEATGWVAKAGSDAEKMMTQAQAASDLGGRDLQVKYLELLYQQLGLMAKDGHFPAGYRPTPSDHLFFWINVKKINNVSWNGKGRIEFLQGLIGSMFLQSQNVENAMSKIASG